MEKRDRGSMENCRAKGKAEDIRARLIRLTEELVRFRSDSERPLERRKCIEYIERYLKEECAGEIRMERTNSNGIISLYVYNPEPAIRRQKEILLCGHYDVIEGEPGDFLPRHDSRWIYGRGTGDMKSGVAVMLELFIRRYKKRNVSLLITGDEEVGGADGTGLLAKRLRPSVVLIPEPTEGYLVIKEKGDTWVDISVEGPGGHGSTPWAARNAVDILYEIIEALRRHFRTARKEAWVDTLSIGAFAGGSLDISGGRFRMGAANVIAGHASARLDIRITEKTTHQKVYGIIKRVVADKRRELGHSYRIETSPAKKIQHMNTPTHLPEVRRMKRAYQGVFGRKPIIKGEHGASDGRFFSARKIPALQFGCVSEGIHSTGERAEISSIVMCFKVFDSYVEDN